MVTTKSRHEKGNLYPLYFFIIILPFIQLYWMMPFLSDLTLGADYQLFSINEQMELLFSIKKDTFPLYMPGYTYGHYSSALTLGQIYHPISHIASMLPGYWNGKSLEWNTFLRLLSLGITQLGLFTFLRQLRLNVLFAFILSLITVYNLRMLEAFRYGASLEAYTGHLLLCTAIGWYYIRTSKWLGPLSITGITYILVCSGHPPMMFYGLIGVGLFLLVTPFYLGLFLSDIEVDSKSAFSFWTKTGLYIGLGILLASAYTLPFYFEFVASNIEYAKSPTLIGGEPPETLVGALNNFFVPFLADVISGFGGSSLILLALLLPLLRYFKIKFPAVIWIIWGILLFSLLYSLGSHAYIHTFAWKYFPFVSSAGVPGRIAMIIPLFIMMMLAWIFKVGSISIQVNGQRKTLTTYMFLSLIAIVLIPLYLLPIYLLKPAVGNFTPHFIRKIPFWIEFLSVLLGMVSLSALVLYGRYPGAARTLGFILCLVLMLQLGTIMQYGTFIEKKYDKPTFTEIDLKKKKKIDFTFRFNPGLVHSVVSKQINRSFVEPFWGKLYTQIISVNGQDDAYDRMERERTPQQIFVEGYDPEKAEFITEAAKNVNEGRVDLLYSSYNRLKFKIFSPKPVLFGMSYPFTGHWSAWVNGNKVPIYRANGIAHAVEVPDGECIVEFRYWSKVSFTGMIITCTVLLIIGSFVCFYSLTGTTRITGMFLVLIICAGGFMLWYNSLYNGDNLKTEYSWNYAPPQSKPNLAYGKRTSGFFVQSGFLNFHSSKAVDGETEPGSGFIIKPINNRALIIDINQKKEIKTILIYGKMKTPPLLAISQEGDHWHHITSINAMASHSNPFRIDFQESQFARFIRITPFEHELEIDEVEVY